MITRKMEPHMMQSMSFHHGTFNIAVDFDLMVPSTSYHVVDVNGSQERPLVTFRDAGELFSWLRDGGYEPGFYL